MYLTRMHLNPRRRQTLRMSRDPQIMHAAVASSFPPSAEPGRVLWRLDESPSRSSLLIVSKEVPSLEHVQEQAGWETERTWETRDYSPLLSRIRIGQEFGFRLTANPVHVVAEPDGTSKRRAHVSVKYQTEWLLQRAERMGVEFVPSVPNDLESAAPRITGRETLRFNRRNSKVTLARVTYEGVIKVVDAPALRETLTSGVGRGKAYGCGLMTLAPVSQRI